ncbi:IS200/IS605 family transposase [Sulfolobus sp. E11-6]|uniref:IS200/IS605 family transposase n=1 Tax=Sulfolobus sp. E11-6 TaxID=2663020 RepID=UPI001294F3DD|nr:IS200/IS605 family transposase [Sulfolobus sp. E11-6]QGA68546.1 IS200/IS605 family transposase [Sulfolobus sp. E11-6]
MRKRLNRNAHSVYVLYYHYVQVVKYRRKVFDNEEIVNFLKETIHEISKTFEVEVIDISVDKDHFHMLFKAKPTLDIPRYINTIKTITSREIQRKFPQVKEKLWKGHLWSPSYFLATSGQVTLEILKNYVESQGECGQQFN